MEELCDLQVHINGQQTFFLHEKTISRFSGKLRKIIKQEKRKTQIRKAGIQIDDFPGGSDGFELISRFCYNNGEIDLSFSNVCLLHCCAVFLGMNNTLLRKTTDFFENMLDWSWNDVLICLKNCDLIFSYADSFGIIEKLISSLISKIAQNSDLGVIFPCSSSSSSSPDSTAKSCSLLRVSSSSSTKELWWFDEMTILPPTIIERFAKTLENNSLVLTRFLLYYLKTINQAKLLTLSRFDYGGLAERAVNGVVLMGKSGFSCRGVFWVLRIVSRFGISRECRSGLERLIGGMLDQAKLDDLLVSNNGSNSVYDVNLVLRLIRVFCKVEEVCLERMKKVGGLIDKYLGEIAPDQSLKLSKFLGVAESLGDGARDCFDGVYKAIDIYLESHPCLSLEERSRLCRCLKYEKLSLEACKELAKNPRIPPRIAVQALASQHSNLHYNNPPSQLKSYYTNDHESPFNKSSKGLMVMYSKNETKDHHCRFDSTDQNDSFNEHCHGDDDNDNDNDDDDDHDDDDDDDAVKLNLQKMQWRVVELEKVCREMKGEMSRMVKGKVIIPHSSNAHGTRPMQWPRLC